MRKFLASVLVLVFVFTISISAQSDSAVEMDNDTKKIYNAGNKMLKAGDYEGALAKYDEALKTSSDYKIYYQRGVTLRKMRNLPLAAESFQNCVKSNAGFAVGYNGLGGVRFAQAKYQAAIDAYKKFAELTDKQKYKAKANQNISKAYAGLAQISKADGNYNKAVTELKNAIAAQPFDKAYILLAEIYVDQAKYDLALEAADKAMNIRKGITKGAIYYYKGMAFKGKKDKVKSKESFELGKNDKQYGKNCKHELKVMSSY